MKIGGDVKKIKMDGREVKKLWIDGQRIFDTRIGGVAVPGGSPSTTDFSVEITLANLGDIRGARKIWYSTVVTTIVDYWTGTKYPVEISCNEIALKYADGSMQALNTGKNEESIIEETDDNLTSVQVVGRMKGSCPTVTNSTYKGYFEIKDMTIFYGG